MSPTIVREMPIKDWAKGECLVFHPEMRTFANNDISAYITLAACPSSRNVIRRSVQISRGAFF